MAQPFAETLESVISLCQQQFEAVQIVRYDIQSDYGVLWLEIVYQTHLLRIREVIRHDNSRKYAYYLFQGTRVIGGVITPLTPEHCKRNMVKPILVTD